MCKMIKTLILLVAISTTASPKIETTRNKNSINLEKEIVPLEEIILLHEKIHPQNVKE